MMAIELQQQPAEINADEQGLEPMGTGKDMLGKYKTRVSLLSAQLVSIINNPQTNGQSVINS